MIDTHLRELNKMSAATFLGSLHEPDLPSGTGTVSGVLVLKPRSEEESLELQNTETERGRRWVR